MRPRRDHGSKNGETEQELVTRQRVYIFRQTKNIEAGREAANAQYRMLQF